MSSAHQYDSLGRIMSLGGEIRLGVGLALGYSPSRISALFVGRLGNVSPTDRISLLEFAQAGADAASEINSSSDELDTLLGIIPVNPNLWGDDPAGRRVLYVGQFWTPDMDTPQQRRIESPDGLNFNQLTEWLLKELYDYLTESPPLLSNSIEAMIEAANAELLFTERRF